MFIRVRCCGLIDQGAIKGATFKSLHEEGTTRSSLEAKQINISATSKSALLSLISKAICLPV